MHHLGLVWMSYICTKAINSSPLLGPFGDSAFCWFSLLKIKIGLVLWSFKFQKIKSVNFKKTIAWISLLLKLWYFQYKSKQKVTQFWKKQDSRNCLLKMNGLSLSMNTTQLVIKNLTNILDSDSLSVLFCWSCSTESNTYGHTNESATSLCHHQANFYSDGWQDTASKIAFFPSHWPAEHSPKAWGNM